MSVRFDQRIQGLIRIVGEFADVAHYRAEVFGLWAVFLHSGQLIQHTQHGFELALFAVNDDLADYFPKVFFSEVNFLAFARWGLFGYQLPFQKSAKVRAHIARGNIKFFFHLIRIDRLRGNEQQCVYLRHSGSNTPATRHFAP